MSIADFVSHLQTLDVRLSAEGERLRLNAPKGVLTDSLRSQIAERKQELLEFFRDNNRSRALLPPPILRQTTGSPAPLSFAQERLWFLEQLESGITVYNICRAWRLIGKLNPSALESSLNEIVRRHEILRSSIRVANGQPVQVGQPPFELKIFVTDLQRMSDHEREQEISSRIQQAADTPFDFSAGRFLRAALFRAGNDEHILILATHHIVSDAWSMGILTRELWSFYEAYAVGAFSSLEDLRIQYADFGVWQREWLQGEVLEAQVSYWKKQLSDLPNLNLPTDRPRPARQSFHGARTPITLPEALTAAINELSNQSGVTPFMTLLAAFQVLLCRYCGQEDVVVGSPIANRTRTELEPLIGFFVNTLVLRSDLSGNPTFSEFLARVREACLGAYKHQDLPFEKLVQELQPERDQSRNPLFQVMFVLQNATRPFAGVQGLRIEPVERENTRSQLDLSLFLRERDRKLIGFFDYSTDLFDPSTIERMAGHFQTLLEGIVADPGQAISSLPLLTEAEQHHILVEWNDTAADYPKDSCIHALFEAQVERTPNAVALEFEGKSLTYRELNGRANQLAHYLRGIGVEPEQLVGICVDRSFDMVVGLLGILKAGAAYVPLDPAYPKERLAFMLEDAQVSVLVTQESFIVDRKRKPILTETEGTDGNSQSSILDPRRKVVCLDRDWEAINRESGNNITSDARTNNLAYVIYTSGSTGKPKGVAIEHQNTCNLLHWAKTVYTHQELEGVLASTSICFDLSVFELFVPLCWGGKVVLVENALCLLEDATAKEVTLLNTVPSVMAALLSQRPLPDSIHTVNLAGERLRPNLVKQIYGVGPIEKIYDLYGPSETTTYSTFAVRTPDGPNTIGRPIANSQIYILDNWLQPVPIGTAGELYIGGAGLSRGYLNRPELTVKRFVHNPFSKDRNARLYRTGDRARFRPNGNIEFLGRTDNQVKIRGYRVELAEIEATLNQHPNVKDCAVVTPGGEGDYRGDVPLQKGRVQTQTGAFPVLSPPPRQGPSSVVLPTANVLLPSQAARVERKEIPESDRRLVAYFVPTNENSSPTDLRNFVKQKLPEYMIPSFFVPLDTLPLTPNGKIDRNALSSPNGSGRDSNQDFTAPSTEIEELVTQAWRKVLNVESLSVYDNFFELGGHSLLATQIVARLREAFDREIPLSVLFDAPTVADLSVEIEKLLRDSDALALPPIMPVPRDEPLPLSMNQEHLWRLDQMMPGTHFFNMPYVYQLSGDLNVEALAKALKEIVRRHEALRTRFGALDGNPIQIVGDGSDFELTSIDLRGESTEKVSEDAADLIVAERQAPFDLALGPLVRTKLLRLTDNDYLLLLTMHHIISDYWSMQIFRRELLAVYEAYSQGRRSPLPEPAVQFADYAAWERRMLGAQFFQTDLRFWTRKLGGESAEEFDAKGLRTKPFAPLAPIATEYIHIHETLWSDLKSLAQEENCTPATVISAVLGIVVGHCRAREDIMIAMLVANRANLNIEHTIGHFVNTIILRTQISKTTTARQVLRDIRTQMVQAIIHQQYPFEDLARFLKSKNHHYGKSLFQVLLSYQSFSPVTSQFPGLTFAPFHISHAEATPTRFDMVCRLRETSTTLTWAVNWRVDAFTKNIGPEVAALSVNLLKRIVAFPDERVSEALDEAQFREC